MVAIESGISPDQASGAILAGQDRQDRRNLLQYEKDQRQFEQEQQVLGELADYQSRYAQQRAQALQDVNERAQLGDVAAQRAQFQQAQMEGRPPEEKMVKEFQDFEQNLIKSGASEKVINQARMVANDAFKAHQDGKESAAFEGAFNTAMEDAKAGNVFDEEGLADIQRRAQAGESKPGLIQEMAKAREADAKKQVYFQESQDAIAKLEGVVETAKGTDVYEPARVALEIFKSSQSSQAKEGQAALVQEKIMRIMMGADSDAQEGIAKNKAMGPEMPGLGGMRRGEMQEELESEPFMGFGGPDIPPLGADFKAQAQAQRAEKEKRYPQAKEARKEQEKKAKAIQSALSESKDGMDLAERLKAAGIPLTRQLMAEIQRLRQE